MKKINPTRTESWKKLKAHYKEMKNVQMKDLFAGDKKRFRKFSLKKDDVLLDYSKNRITEETLELLVGLAEECGLKEAIKSMFAGEKINETILKKPKRKLCSLFPSN